MCNPEFLRDTRVLEKATGRPGTVLVNGIDGNCCLMLVQWDGCFKPSRVWPSEVSGAPADASNTA